MLGNTVTPLRAGWLMFLLPVIIWITVSLIAVAIAIHLQRQTARSGNTRAASHAAAATDNRARNRASAMGRKGALTDATGRRVLLHYDRNYRVAYEAGLACCGEGGNQAPALERPAALLRKTGPTAAGFIVAHHETVKPANSPAERVAFVLRIGSEPGGPGGR